MPLWQCGSTVPLRRDCRWVPRDNPDSRNKCRGEEGPTGITTFNPLIYTQRSRSGATCQPDRAGMDPGQACRVTIDTGASVTIARPDMVTGQAENKVSRAYVLQTASGETHCWRPSSS